MSSEEIKLTVTAATDSAVSGMQKVKSSMDSVSSSTKQAALSAGDLEKAFVKSQQRMGAGFDKMGQTLGMVTRGFGSVISKAMQFEKNSGADGAGSLTSAMQEMKNATDEMIVSLMTGTPSLISGLKSFTGMVASAAKAISSLPGPVRTLILGVTALAVVIGVATKITMGFGVAFKTAIPWVAGIAAAIAAVIAIVILLKSNWEEVTLYWQIGVEKVKRYMNILWSGIKIGALYIAQFMIKAAGIMFMPILKAIDTVIWAYNKLTGSNIQNASDMMQAADDGLQAQIEVEEQKLAQAQEISDKEKELLGDLERVKDEKRQAELEKERQATAEKKKNVNSHSTLVKEKTKSELDLKLKAASKFASTSKAYEERERKMLQEKFDNMKSGYDESSQFVLNNLNKKSKTEFAIWKGLSMAQVMIDTYKAAMSAYSAMSGIPYVGPALGAAAAAAVTALGLRSAKNIASQKFQPRMATGGIIKGSSLGTSIIAGEGNRSEAIIPLENPEAMNKLGGMGQTNNISINIENMLSDPKELPLRLAEKIDAALYNLHRKNSSAFGSSLS